MPLKLAILKVCVWFQARMAKLADAADLKSADLYRSWGFKSPSGHHNLNVFNSPSSLQAVLLSGPGGVVEGFKDSTRRCIGDAKP
jgi:hypothetical protein